MHGARVQPERRRKRRKFLLALHHDRGQEPPRLGSGVGDRDRLGRHDRIVGLFTRCFKYADS
jgi:hypothetical protein